MAQELEHILNYLSLKKSRGRWRLVALGLILVGVIALFARGAGSGPAGDHIARVRVDGLITGDQKQISLLNDVAEDDSAKAVIVRIDSPGGTTAGSEVLYLAIRKVAAKKPVIAVMDTVAASGGYIAALATDRIYARGNTITGSIGVIFTFPEVSRLLDTLGIKFEEIKSGELKAEPSPYKPVSEKARAYSALMVEDGFVWFKSLVAERRKMSAEQVVAVSDGRVFTGRQAKASNLIDEIGGETEALLWLETEKKISATLEVLDWQPPVPLAERILGASVAETLAAATGLDRLSAATERTKLDGLLVLWHPAM